MHETSHLITSIAICCRWVWTQGCERLWIAIWLIQHLIRLMRLNSKSTRSCTGTHILALSTHRSLSSWHNWITMATTVVEVVRQEHLLQHKLVGVRKVTRNVMAPPCGRGEFYPRGRGSLPFGKLLYPSIAGLSQCWRFILKDAWWLEAQGILNAILYVNTICSTVFIQKTPYIKTIYTEHTQSF